MVPCRRKVLFLIALLDRCPRPQVLSVAFTFGEDLDPQIYRCRAGVPDLE